ncbi:LOB domain-containing protein 7-like [Trifolium pratense]|nr:LOB domain-containing protein 7-like [Trifolium pratense]CAJ2661105.1 unnamed protein product [Trifolium pratense]
MNNNNNNNNNIVSRNGNGTTQACAACKYQRRKCGPTCILAPYFPHDRQKQFLNAHKLFGVGKITNMIKNVPPELRDVTMGTIMYQSDMRAIDPVGGCYRALQQLQSQCEFFQAELDLTRQHIAICRASSQSQQLAANSNHHHHHYNDMIMNNNGNDVNDAAAAMNILNQFNQQHFVEEQMNINMLPQPQQLQPQYVDDVDLNPNYVPLQQEDLNTWVNSIPLSPLTLNDNKKEMEEEEGENEEIVGDDKESDQKPVFDLINEMNSLDTGSNNIDPGHQ